MSPSFTVHGGQHHEHELPKVTFRLWGLPTDKLLYHQALNLPHDTKICDIRVGIACGIRG